MNPLTVRRASLDDLDAIMALEHAIFPADAWSAQAMRAELLAPTGFYLVAEAPDAAGLAGYAGLSLAGDSADVQTIAVAPEHRRAGLGRSLMRRLIRQARRAGAHDLQLEVRADNPNAQALYRQLGFEHIRTRRGYYRPDGVDAFVMRLKLPPEPLVLGIETSCDETGIGLVRGSTLLANAVASSMDEHARFGGVVPEIAARAHLEALQPTIELAVREAGVTLEDVAAVAVTAGPGLSGALMVGIAAAKGLALALDRPVYGVNHLVGHVAADLLREDGPGELEAPTVALLVSGGHTSLLLVRDLVADVELLGETIDDAAGEAFDKVARLIGLAYPGGPAIDRLAAEGDPAAIRFPRGLTLPKDLERHRYDFSFSGLKTAVARWVEARQDAGERVPVADVAAGFREAVADVLTAKAVAACRDLGVAHLLLAGGVAANARVRALAQERCADAGIALRIPPLALCTDNGAMIAALGAQVLAAGVPASALDLGADSSLPVTSPVV